MTGRAAMPRVALVLGRWDVEAGGLERAVHGLARHLIARGYPVHVVATAFASGSCDLPIVRHRVEPSRSPLAQAELFARAVRTVAADIVHDMGSGWSGDVFQPHTGSRLACLDAELTRLDPLRRLRHRMSPGVRRWRREMAELEQRQLDAARRIVVLSRFVAAGLRRRYRVADERMVLIPNGVDTDRFTPCDGEAERLGVRAAFGLEGGLLFTMVANNFRLKGVDVALSGLAGLARSGVDARLAVAGSGVVEPYRRKATRLGIADRVRFLGPVEHVERLLSASDVFLQPTVYDACSLTTLEAMASGLPVVTTRANGASELMAEGQGLVLESAGDARALRAAMQALLPEGARRALGAAARRGALAQRAETRFRQIERQYRDLLSGAAPADGPASGQSEGNDGQ